jgi:hypothetical protein
MNRTRPSAAVVAALAVALAAFAAPAGAQSLQSGVVTAFGAYLSVPVGKAWVSSTIPLPACPPGEKFLIQSVAGAPDPRSLGTTSLPAWSVMALASQYGTIPETGALTGTGVPLAAYGNDAENAEAHFPGGFPTSRSEITYFVFVRGGLQVSSVRFNVHFSGACGKPSVTP